MVRNEVCVKISGLNLARIIDKLVQKNILINNIIIKKQYIKFYIQERDLCKFDEICKKERKFYTIIYRSGIKNILSKLPYFIGSFLAIIIMFAYMFSYNMFVINLNVSYSSNLAYDLTKVNEVLKENNIVAGMKKGKCLESDIRMILLSNLDDISDCRVDINGINLNICVYPAIKNEVFTEDIYSKYDAVITEIEVYSGSSELKVGDVVKNGDLLIKNDKGASGKIVGKVYFIGTEIYNENQFYAELTGNVYKYKNYKIFNKNFINGDKCTIFADFLEIKCEYFINKNLLIPIVCEEITCSEYVIKDKLVPFLEVEKEIKEKAYKNALAKLENFDGVKNTTYSIVREDNYVRVDCYIETEISLF